MKYKIIKDHKLSFLNPEGIVLEGKDFVFERLNKKAATSMILFNYDYSKFFLVKQFRFGPLKNLWEIPAGVLEDHLSPVDNMLKEIKEETGYNKEDVIDIEEIYQGYVSPGYTKEKTILFCARLKENAIAGELELDEHEEILEKGFYSYEEAKKLGAFECMKTFLAYQVCKDKVKK